MMNFDLGKVKKLLDFLQQILNIVDPGLKASVGAPRFDLVTMLKLLAVLNQEAPNLQAAFTSASGSVQKILAVFDESPPAPPIPGPVAPVVPVPHV